MGAVDGLELGEIDLPRDYQIDGPSPFHLFPSSLFRPASPPPFSINLHIDGLIVLGARLTPQGEPGRVARLRLVHALQLWRGLDCRAYLLLTGGRLPGRTTSEARAMADWSLRQVKEYWGADMRAALEGCLLLEEVSLSTAASAKNTLPLTAGRGSRTVGLVTDAIHIHRARFLFQRQFHPHGIRVQPLAAHGLLRHYWQNRRYDWLVKMALREGGAWGKVLVRLIRQSLEK
jgi:uncharacterized SAM-binding protein YcdF (DUF218 family)